MDMDCINSVFWSASRGMLDSLRGAIVIFSLDRQLKEKAKTDLASPKHKDKPTKSASPKKPSTEEQPNILWRTIQCSLFNGGVFWFSMVIFESTLLPGIHWFLGYALGSPPAQSSLIWIWSRSFVLWTFSTVWVMPLFLLSKVVNSLWFLDIASVAYKHCRGRSQAVTSMSRWIADTVFSVVVQVLFLIQAMMVSYLPTPLASVLHAVHMAMLYSLYSFEYKWVNMGLELHKRLTFIESNWPYFVGFGLPLHLITCLTDSYIVSGCFFSMAFPLFLVSGNASDPVVRIHSDFPMPLFTPVIAISNTLLRRSVKV